MMNSRVAFIMTEIEYFIIHLAFRANAGKICKKEIFYLCRFLLKICMFAILARKKGYSFDIFSSYVTFLTLRIESRTEL